MAYKVSESKGKKPGVPSLPNMASPKVPHTPGKAKNVTQKKKKK